MKTKEERKRQSERAKRSNKTRKRKPKVTKKQVLDAIEGSRAIMSTIANRLGVDWHTAKKYIDADEELTQAFWDEREKKIDFTESCLLRNMEDGDTRACIWFQETYAHHRFPKAQSTDQEFVLKPPDWNEYED